MIAEIITKDKIPLRGTMYKSKNAKAVILLNSATATKTVYYRPFIEFLVRNDFHVFSWNYRGICESKLTTLKGSEYKYSDIGIYDIPAVIDYLKSSFPNLPLLCVGHSAGGQQIGLAYNFDKIDGLVVVAASAGYYPYLPFFYRLKAIFFFKIFSPISGFIYKYVVASKLNLMEDLPTPFVKEWGEWCGEKELFFSPKYKNFLPEGAYKNFKIPIHVFVADDDEICTEKNMHNFWKNVSSSQEIKFTRYESSTFPKKAVGHFGYFKKENQIIWNDILNALNRFLT